MKNSKGEVNIFCGPIKSKYLFVRGFFEYLMQYILYFKSNKIVRKFNPNYLICYSPSIFFNYLISKIIIKNKIKSYLILRDIFPYWAIECGYIKNFFLKKFYINQLNSFLKNFDNIGVESFSNVKYLQKKTNLTNITHLPNWIKKQNISFKNKKIFNSFIFSGNLGGGQDIEKVYNFFSRIRIRSNNSNLCVLGDGMNTSNLKKFQNLNINYYKKVSFKKYIKFLSNYEYGIISLKEEIQSVNYPGRLLTYLNNGLPIIVLSNKANELSKFVTEKKIGVVINSKENINQKLKKLKNIRSNFIKYKTNIKVLDKFFNLKKNADKIFLTKGKI